MNELSFCHQGGVQYLPLSPLPLRLGVEVRREMFSREERSVGIVAPVIDVVVNDVDVVIVDVVVVVIVGIDKVILMLRREGGEGGCGGRRKWRRDGGRGGTVVGGIF